MAKQSSIEWLFAHLVPHLDWSKVEDRKLFRKLKAEAEQMHKREVVDAFNSGDFMHHYKIDIDKDGHEFYEETYGGNNE